MTQTCRPQQPNASLEAAGDAARFSEGPVMEMLGLPAMARPPASQFEAAVRRELKEEAK